jgi:hypothetical protein
MREKSWSDICMSARKHDYISQKCNLIQVVVNILVQYTNTLQYVSFMNLNSGYFPM